MFDPSTKALQKARAALSPEAAEFDYLRDHIAEHLVDRLQDVTRSFPTTLDLFCGAGHFRKALVKSGHTAGITRLYQCDVHHALLRRAMEGAEELDMVDPRDGFVVTDDGSGGENLPELDLIVSGGGLHWVNDLPRTLSTFVHLLKPDGVFLGAMLGGETLQELRISLQLAEQELHHRLAPRVSPTVHTRDAARLLSAVGLTLPTADVDRLVVPFKDMFALMKHLKGMGETNALVAREVHAGRAVFERAAEIYEERFGIDGPGGVRCVAATFDVVHMIGWRKAVGQPMPKERGSATVSMADITAMTSGEGSEKIPDGEAER